MFRSEVDLRIGKLQARLPCQPHRAFLGQVSDILQSPSSLDIPDSDLTIPNLTWPAVQDEGLKRLLMSWYYAGYYTGLYEGEQKGKSSAS